MARRKAKQLRLAVRQFNVRGEGFEIEGVQAGSASAAKYAVFTHLRELGRFALSRDPFRDFLERRPSAVEIGRHA